MSIKVIMNISFEEDEKATDEEIKQAVIESLDSLCISVDSLTVSRGIRYPTAPYPPEEGMSWINTMDDRLYKYIDGVWTWQR